MKVPLKQAAGIDVAKDELVVCLGRLQPDLSKELYLHGIFPNTQKGIAKLCSWVAGHTDGNAPLHYVMEATGVYHERLAHHLDACGRRLSIVLPSKISSYCKVLQQKTINDKTCSETIALFGLERTLEPWHRPAPVYGELKGLVRERDQLVAERTAIKNQLHAESHQAVPHAGSLERMGKRIALLDGQEAEIIKEIRAIVGADAGLQAETQRLTSIPGIGLLTAVTVLAETNGFELIRNKRQLTSYAGLDVTEKQSGTSVRGKRAISKKGNRMIRKCLHLPALSAIRHSPWHRSVFARLVGRHGVKMKAAVAIQRKLLELMFTLFKNKTIYQDHCTSKQKTGQPEDHPAQACTKTALET